MDTIGPIIIILMLSTLIGWYIYKTITINKQLKLQEEMDNLKKDFVYYPKDRARRTIVVGVLTDNTLRLGVSECSKKDQFVKVKGRNIARGRALSKHPQAIIPLLGIKEEDSKNVWDLFLTAAKTAELPKPILLGTGKQMLKELAEKYEYDEQA